MKKITLILSAIILPVSFVIGQIITTVAGGPPPNNVSATSIGMMAFGTIADKHGNIYVSDGSNSVIRKVDLSTGMATIVAGTQNFGHTGDGGQATAASLESPADVAIDTAGNLYIGDLNGYGIRKVNLSTGIITNVVGNGTAGYSGDGGPATAAEISGESGIGFDTKNNMYIADFGNNRIRKVNATTGIITTIAGTGAAGYNGDNIAATTAQLNYPAGVCVDDTGNVFIAEQSNSRVRKIEWNTGIITTLAGDGSFAYGGDGGPATAAELWAPLSVKLDTAGNLYIADWGNNRVRKITTSTGIITTVAGNGTYGHSGDGGPAVSAELGDSYCVALDRIGNLFIVEGFNSVNGYNVWVRKVDAVTHDISTVAGNGNGDYNGDGVAATSAQLCYPSAVKMDATGNMYIADWANNRIRKINSFGIINTLAGNNNWGFVNNVVAPNGEMFGPNDLTFDKTGNMFIADFYNDRIRKIDLNDSILNFAGNGAGAPYQGYYSGDNGQATAAELYYPSGVAVDDTGNVFIADFANCRVRKVDWKTGIITTIAGNGTAGYSGDGGIATAAKLNGPVEVALDDSDNVYIVDEGNNRIRKVNYSTGKIVTVAGDGFAGYNGDGEPATTAKLNYPTGIAVTPNGAIYIADESNNRIRVVNPVTHAISTVAGDGSIGFSGDGGPATSAQLNEPENIGFDAAGNMYIADNYNNRIRKVTNVLDLGVNHLSAPTAQLKVYPNPTNGYFTIALQNANGESQLEVYSMLGEKVYSQLSTFSSPLSINLSNQPTGIYLYRIVSETGELLGQGKLIIQK